jgi:superfamily II DNA or RNA helicase
VLVLVDQVRHGNELLKRIGEQAVFVHGSTARKRLQETTRRFSEGKIRCLVATAGLFQEGVSIDGIHVLIMAGGLKSRTKVIQTVGRGVRCAPGKTSCTYVDFFDDDVAGIFRSHSRQRIRVLKEEGFYIAAPEEKPSRPDIDEEIPATWAHLPETHRFVQVDGEGHVRAKAVCVAKDLVPDKFCKRCSDKTLCLEGGRIEWHDQD